MLPASFRFYLVTDNKFLDGFLFKMTKKNILEMVKRCYVI